MLLKKTSGGTRATRLATTSQRTSNSVDRRTFLKRSGLTIGGVAAASTAVGGVVAYPHRRGQAFPQSLFQADQIGIARWRWRGRGSGG